MKRALFVLGMLLTFGLFCACSSDDESENVTDDSSERKLNDLGGKLISPVQEGDNFVATSDFFNSELPFGTYSKGFFVGSCEQSGEEVCYTINSKKELEDIYSGDKDLPEIDFQQYTLVIGERIMPALGYKCAKQEIVYATKDSDPVLNLYIENIYEYKPTALSPLYFWGLYPIKHLSDIKINIILL